MIQDTLSHADLYEKVHPAFARAFAFLRDPATALLEPGRYELDGDRLYVSIQNPETRPWEGADFEAHNRYIDIQYMIEGDEIMGYAPRETLTISQPYNSETDFMLYAGEGERLYVRQGSFVIFFPDDAHKPIVHPNGHPVHVRKAVVKVRVD